MQNELYLIYILACFGGVWLANRTPMALSQAYQVGDVTYFPDLRALKFLTVVFMLAGATVGGILPSSLAFILDIRRSTVTTRLANWLR